MATKVSSRPEPFFPALDPIRERLATPPATTQEYVAHLRILGRQIHERVQFMCAASRLAGSSSERKAEAVTAFYRSLRSAEKELARIQEELQLG